MKILVVEDEPVAAAFLSRGLREEGYAVDVAGTSADADRAVAVYEYDLIVLDVMIPGLDGFQLLTKWRGAGLSVPVLFLTARDDLPDRVRGLDLGGDDYLTKPFRFEELLARIRALLRRSTAVKSSAAYSVGDLEIDLAAHRVRRSGRDLDLTAREFQLLEFFVLHQGKLVTRTQLWEHVWESNAEPDSNVVDVYVRYLRDKLGRDREYIRTRRGAGYVFADPAEKLG
jgi:two-component system copper resistance phosphate regulon response regulator CusR